MTRPTITNDNKRVLLELMQEPPRIPYWQAAEQIGIHENTFAKRMRKPDDETAEEIRAAIEAIRERQ